MSTENFAIVMVFWAAILLFFMSIGGYFMFRKFMKTLPKADGKSKLDWQNYYVDTSRHMWTEDSKGFLELLVSPVPGPFRDIARHSIAARIAQVALEQGAKEVTQQHCIEGYILATPKRDYASLIKFLEKQQIDYAPYKHLMV
ncbi:MAG: hypothetical protein K0R67_2130 [Paenibacillus sp.]|jgi:hypothetical protein|nr:hypothetical protein [Paenibacillus sp.]